MTKAFLAGVTFLALLPAQVLAGDWPRAATQVIDESAQAGKEAAQVRASLEVERTVLTAQANSLKAETEAAQAEMDRLQARFEELLAAEEAQRARLAENQEEVKNLEAAIRLAARETGLLLATSLATPARPERLNILAPFEDQDRFPGLEDLKALVEVLFQEMEQGGRITLRQGEYIDPAGHKDQARILTVANFSSYYGRQDNLGFLRPTASGTDLSALAQPPAWTERRSLAAYLAGEAEALPLDPSGGQALAHLKTARGVRDWLAAGGLLVWPILVLAGLALLLIFERLASLGLIKADSTKVMARLKDLTGRGRWDQGLELCQKNRRSPSCRVMAAALESRGRSREAVEAAVEEAILKQLPRLERFLPTLSVFAAIAPLLGLLGTVTGMIETFQVITRFGTSDPKLMAGGISEALITTQLGLAVAMPIIVIHHFLERRVDKVVGDMEEKGLALAAATLD